MQIYLDDILFNIDIVRKKQTKNTYLRIKENNTIYITTNIRTKDKDIIKIIEENKKSILRMFNKYEIKSKNENYFWFLGKKYEVILTNDTSVTFGHDKVLIGRDVDIDKWYKKQALHIFKEHFDLCYHKFSRNIIYPSLTIRKMKSRWGVCNTRLKKITLNLELIKKDTKYLDYVIMHELSHLIEANHSINFWKVVEENVPDYKNIRKQMKDF